jgi:uncharacterized protein (TIGR01777 family)
LDPCVAEQIKSVAKKIKSAAEQIKINTMHILIIGGSGFLGRHLTKSLIKDNQITIKTRNKQNTADVFSGPDFSDSNIAIIETYEEVTQAPDCVISLAGSGIIDKRWNTQRQQELIDSRITPLQELSLWLEKTSQTVDKLLVGSAIGFYGYHPDPETTLSENDAPFHDFCHKVCGQVEEFAESLHSQFKQICHLRTGVVLAQNDGAFKKMLMPAKFHLNGKMGDGKQWVSWIHIQDWLKAVQYILSVPSPRKAYNLTSPNPVTNAELSKAIGTAISKPIQLPVPALSLKLLIGKGSQLLLGSQKVLPDNLLAANFEFEYPEIKSAVANLVV